MANKTQKKITLNIKSPHIIYGEIFIAINGAW